MQRDVQFLNYGGIILGCCKGSNVPHTRGTSSRQGTLYHSILQSAQAGMTVDTLVSQAVEDDTPEQVKRGIKTKIVQELYKRGFRISPAGRLLRR